jgi:hypothetical protein
MLLPLTVLADSNATFLNSGGTWKSNAAQTQLTLLNSSLSGVSNLISPYDCPPPACSGTVGLTTGTYISGSLTSGTALFGSGGSFDITSTGAGGGFTFMGSFSSASWTMSGSGKSAFWTFVGQITGGKLTLDPGGPNQMQFTNIDAGTFDITTVGGQPKLVNGLLHWTNNTGSTNFPSPVPEPSTLALFGTGVIALGLLTRRRLSGKTTDSALD